MLIDVEVRSEGSSNICRYVLCGDPTWQYEGEINVIAWSSLFMTSTVQRHKNELAKLLN